MKKILLYIVFFLSSIYSFSQTYPFQNTKLDENKRLDNLISLMTLEEKINCLSTRPSIPRLGVKGTRIVEGLHGLALSGPANWAVKGKGEAPTSTFPQAYGLAQTWDTELLTQLAALEAEECRFLTQNKNYESAGLIVLAPNADLGRDIRWGRTEECYGEDAYFNSRMVVAYIKGLQGDNPTYWKTASLMKHFLANSNENNRIINSSDFDERLFHEYYAYPFYKGVTEGGSRAYMTAYNKYNGIPCIVHSMLKNITVNQWGQNGIIATDGGAFQLLVNAQHHYPDLHTAAVACLQAGITMFLDDYKKYVSEAVDKKLLAEKDIDNAIRGTLRVMLKLGLFDQSPANPYSKIGITDSIAPWTKAENQALIRKATAKSVVLLKNEQQLLPLNKKQLKTVAVIGWNANAVISDWYAGTPPYAVTALQGIKNELGSDVQVLFAATNKADSAVLIAKKADVAIVCVGNHPLSYNLGWEVSHVPSDGREGVDRGALTLEQEDLVKLVYAANPKTVMVLISSFPYAIQWSKENVPAIVHITQSSQELGNGLADVLFGNQSPAGRLVQTWSSSIDQLLPILDYNILNGRTYMYDKHLPLFPFGFGLTYTTFTYSDLKLAKPSISEGEKLNISFQLSNTGNYDSDEVVQLYVRFLNSTVQRPSKALKSFKRVFVAKGQTANVSLQLDANELKYWDVQKNAYVLESGNLEFFIGSSSADERLKGNIKIK